MAFSTLPLIAETQFANYLSGNFSLPFIQNTPTGNISGNYSIINAFSIEPFTAPFVMVKIGKLVETEPYTHVYKGPLTIEVVTNIDDKDNSINPVALHDQAAAQIYDLISNQSGVMAAVEAPNFHLWEYFNIGYEQGVAQTSELNRCLSTQLEYTVTIQNLGVS
jgi:hypothetical protein